MIYPEEDFLQLSGLQHFKFCRRQWALIYIENQWAENFRTTDGAILHENAHNGGFTESRGDLLVTRDMRIFSRTLGVSGACDVLEFRRGKTGIPLKGREGLWQPYPVEYKRGQPKENTADALQLCGQAMCLEEMLCCEIPRGALWLQADLFSGRPNDFVVRRGSVQIFSIQFAPQIEKFFLCLYVEKCFKRRRFV